MPYIPFISSSSPLFLPPNLFIRSSASSTLALSQTITYLTYTRYLYKLRDSPVRIR